MLEALRGFVGSWVAKVFLGVLIASFAVWGIAGEVFGPGSSNAVATVGETKVPPSRFMTSYNAALDNMRRVFGRQPTRQQARALGVEQRALAQVVSAATLDEYARRLGVTLSDERLASLIAEQRSFQDSQGRFDRARFEDAVRNARTNEETFIQDQNRAAVRAQIGSAAVAGDLVPEVYEKAALVHARERRVFELLELGEADAGPIPQPTAEQLAAFFEARKADYRAPEYRALSLLKIEPGDIADPDAVATERVRSEYERRIAAYTTPERRSLQQIPFRDEAAATAARAALDDGATFETIVGEQGVARDVVELGKLSRDQVADPAVAEAAFALDLNETSQVVDGRFGPVLVRVTEIEPEQVRTLAEAEPELRQNLALQDAARRIADLYGEIEDARAGGATVVEVAKTSGVTPRTIERVDAQGRDGTGASVDPALPAAQTLLTEAFQADVGSPTNAVQIGSTGYVWFDVENIEAARDRTLDEVRERVAADWASVEREKLLDALAERIKSELEAGKPFATVVPPGKAVVRTEPLTRRATDPRLGRDGIEAGFQGEVGKAAVARPAPERRTVLQVAAILPPETEALPEAQAENARNAIAQDLLQQVIARLQGEYGATVNRPLIEASINRY